MVNKTLQKNINDWFRLKKKEIVVYEKLYEILKLLDDEETDKYYNDWNILIVNALLDKEEYYELIKKLLRRLIFLLKDDRRLKKLLREFNKIFRKYGVKEINIEEIVKLEMVNKINFIITLISKIKKLI
jgi:hypothetical protein